MKNSLEKNYKMPNKFKGKYLKKSEFIKHRPRKWTKEEEKWVMMLYKEGLNNQQICKYTDRYPAQISNKIRRLKKKDSTYNVKHCAEKYQTNLNFLKVINPESILDVYAGVESYYKKIGHTNVIDNDKMENPKTDYNMDSLEFLALMYSQKKKFDLIDLDPFGNAYDCLDLSIKMARKALIVTIGELRHKKLKRMDFAKRYYNIKNIENFTTENIIKRIIDIGKRNKKLLLPVYVKDWKHVARVYFEIKKMKPIYRGIKNNRK